MRWERRGSRHEREAAQSLRTQFLSGSFGGRRGMPWCTAAGCISSAFPRALRALGSKTDEYGGEHASPPAVASPDALRRVADFPQDLRLHFLTGTLSLYFYA